MRKVACAVLFVLASASAAASSGTAGPLDVSRPADLVNTQISTIRADLAKGELYSEISAGEQAKVSDALTRIQTAIDRSGGAELSSGQQVSVFNDQEIVNTVLTRAKDDSRMVCKRTRAVGSNLVTSQCMTVAQRRALSRDSQREMNDIQRNRPLPER